MTSRPILVGYDGSASSVAAARWALDEATREGAPVHLLYAFEWFASPTWLAPGPPLTYPEQEARADVRRMLADVAAAAARTHPSVNVSFDTVDGPPAIRLAERSRHAGLVVLGSRGHGGFSELLVGSTTVTVSAHAACPVVVVRGGDRDPRGHVVAGVDGSGPSILALGFAFEQATARDVPLHVVRAWVPPAPKYRTVDFSTDAVTERERAWLDGLLEQWGEKYPDVTVTSEVVADGPSRIMVEATRNAQLAVVGTRGRGGFRGLLLGSVSQQLIHHSHCPVAIVRDIEPDPSDVHTD